MISEFNLQQFHLLRPEWLLLLLPLIIFAWLLLKQKLFSRNWQSVIDPQLLPHLLIGKPGKANQLPIVLLLIVGTLGIVALAGPVWQKLPQPVFKQQSALVIALDLSRSMDATDLKPSRLTRARHKISDILKLRKEGQTALIAYAANAFVVSPLTDDAETINSLVPSLSTDIMPAQGSRADRALLKARELFDNAGIVRGDVLLITDGVDNTSEQAIGVLRDQGHRLSILAVGTAAGAPIPLSGGGFLKDAQGAIVVPKLDRHSLQVGALAAGGRFSMLTANDKDIKHILDMLEIDRAKSDTEETDMQADVWREEGPLLLLLALPFASLAFRRGYLVLLAALCLPHSPPADAISWDTLWKNNNQIAAERFQQEQHTEAAELFNNPEWKAAAHFKAGQYEEAAVLLENIDHPDAHYNRGNALAKLGQLDEAINAYNQALDINPDHEDAKFNKQLIEQQKQQNQNNQSSDENQSSSDQQQQDSSKQGASNTEDQQGQESEQQNNAQQSSAEQDSQQSEQSSTQESDENTQQDKSQPTTNAEENKRQADKQQEQSLSAAEQEEKLSQQATEQWLRRIPDDPGGLLRNKFEYQYKRQNRQSNETQAW